jgi:hypothetical protein
MHLSLRPLSLLAIPGITVLALSMACNGGSSGSSASTSTPTPAATGAASIILTDAPSDQWSAIEVVVTKVTLLNKTDHTKEVVAFQGATAKINLVDLDSVGELLATAQIPVGTYDALRITIDPASVNLVKADGTTVPTSQVHVQGSSVQVGLSTDLVVTASGSNAVQIDFDLGHPLFLVQMPNGDWAMNLQVKHRPNVPGILAQLAFKHRKGTVASVSATGFVLHTDSGNDLTVNVDNGAWFFDADAKAVGSFAGLTVGKNALVKLRMQTDGTLWAVRVWYSASALQGWTHEGHVVSVDKANNRMFVTTNAAMPRAIAIDADTTFTFHTSQALGTGQATLADVWTGFKVQVEVKDPLAVPMHASAVNIQRAVDGGVIKAATATDFTYSHPMAGDRTHAYASPFTWWYLGLPGITSTVTGDFASAVTGAGDVRVQGVSDLIWNSGTSTWDASTAIFLPVALPQGAISSSYNNGQIGFTFTNSAALPQTLSVSLNPTVGMQPAVLEVVNQSGVVSVAPIDVSAWPTKLVAPAKVRVAVVPKSDNTFAAYAVVVFTGF